MAGRVAFLAASESRLSWFLSRGCGRRRTDHSLTVLARMARLMARLRIGAASLRQRSFARRSVLPELRVPGRDAKRTKSGPPCGVWSAGGTSAFTGRTAEAFWVY